jgi:hypothetical protein
VRGRIRVLGDLLATWVLPAAAVENHQPECQGMAYVAVAGCPVALGTADAGL